MTLHVSAWSRLSRSSDRDADLRSTLFCRRRED
jgi:hypothetical protein